jgi:hypothetical protein
MGTSARGTQAGRGAPIVVAGSLFLAGAMLEALGERPWAP